MSISAKEMTTVFEETASQWHVVVMRPGFVVRQRELSDGDQCLRGLVGVRLEYEVHETVEDAERAIRERAMEAVIRLILVQREEQEK